MRTSDGPPRAVLIAALMLGVAAIVTVLVVALTRAPGPVPISTVPAPAANSDDCTRLIANLPDRLGDFRRAPAVDPAPAGTAAWVHNSTVDPVILRCGLDRPAEFVVGSPLQMVDDVSWLEIANAGRSTWFAVDRAVYVALTMPQDSGPTPIQLVSKAIGVTLEARKIDPAPAPPPR